MSETAASDLNETKDRLIHTIHRDLIAVSDRAQAELKQTILDNRPETEVNQSYNRDVIAENRVMKSENRNLDRLTRDKF